MGKKNKMKSHKASAKRFKITKTGKVLRQHSGRNHNTGKMRENYSRNSRKWEEVENKDVAKKIKQGIQK
ncbi:MAG: 50S ribosomal protein L35 [Petrotogales bacterium]